MPSVLPLVVRTSFRFNGRFHSDRFVTLDFSGFESKLILKQFSNVKSEASSENQRNILKSLLMPYSINRLTKR